jgi:hypothetical protein
VYGEALADVVSLIESARHAAARSVNALMTATYWAIGGESSSRSKAAREVPATGRSC